MRFKDFLKENTDWKLSYPDYTITINDTIDHPLMLRLKTRTNETEETINDKVQQAINTLMKAVNHNKSKTFLRCCMYFMKSQFKVLLNVDKNDKSIKFTTILSGKMAHNTDITNNVYENEEFIEILINL
jgi:hypothetical protein